MLLTNKHHNKVTSTVDQRQYLIGCRSAVVTSKTYTERACVRFINPLQRRGNYSATSKSNKNKDGTLAVDRWAVTFGTARRRLSVAAARPAMLQIETVEWCANCAWWSLTHIIRLPSIIERTFTHQQHFEI